MERPADAGTYEPVLPGQHQPGLALHSAGCPEEQRAHRPDFAQVRGEMPPRENPRTDTSPDSVHASGPLGRAHCVIHGNCNDEQTAVLDARAAAHLLQQQPKKTGFTSSCQAFGHRNLLGTLRGFGPGTRSDPRSPPPGARKPAQLSDFLDRGASLGGASPSDAEVVRLSCRTAGALHGSGIRPGERVAILSANDPLAFACVLGISRDGAVWCPISPRDEAEENRKLLELFGCRCLIFAKSFARWWTTPSFEEWLDRDFREPDPVVRPDDEPCAPKGFG